MMTDKLSMTILITTLLILNGCTMENEHGYEMTQHSSPHKHVAHEIKNFTHHIIQEAPYYIDGPEQSRPPDGYFQLGVRLSIIENNGSYARVESDNGITAYIAILDMKEL